MDGGRVNEVDGSKTEGDVALFRGEREDVDAVGIAVERLSLHTHLGQDNGGRVSVLRKFVEAEREHAEVGAQQQGVTPEQGDGFGKL